MLFKLPYLLLLLNCLLSYAQTFHEKELINEMKQNSRDLTKLDSISKLLLDANSPEALWEGQQTQGYVNLVNSDLKNASLYYNLDSSKKNDNKTLPIQKTGTLC